MRTTKSNKKKEKQYKLAVYSEKGGVGKTTILVSIAKVLGVDNSVFLDADSSSQSLNDVLKFYKLAPKIVYRDSICVLPFLSEIHQSTEYFFIDLAGREASINEIDYFKYIDLMIIPIPPIYSNYSTPIHTVEKLIKNGVDNNKILVMMNYMWPNENLDKKIIDEFASCISLLAEKFKVNVFRQGISFSNNLNRLPTCLNNKNKYFNDVSMLSEVIKSIIIKND